MAQFFLKNIFYDFFMQLAWESRFRLSLSFSELKKHIEYHWDMLVYKFIHHLNQVDIFFFDTCILTVFCAYTYYLICILYNVLKE